MFLSEFYHERQDASRTNKSSQRNDKHKPTDGRIGPFGIQWVPKMATEIVKWRQKQENHRAGSIFAFLKLTVALKAAQGIILDDLVLICEISKPSGVFHTSYLKPINSLSSAQIVCFQCIVIHVALLSLRFCLRRFAEICGNRSAFSIIAKIYLCDYPWAVSLDRSALMLPTTIAAFGILAFKAAAFKDHIGRTVCNRRCTKSGSGSGSGCVFWPGSGAVSGSGS